MIEISPERAEPRRNGDSSERRRFARKPVPEVFVAVELSDTPAADRPPAVSDTAGGVAWAGSAIDISPEGLALTLPDDLPVGTEVLLTFWLDDGTVFSRVPSVVVRKEQGLGLGAVRFEGWGHRDLDALQAYLRAA